MQSTDNNANLSYLRASALAKDYEFLQVLGEGGFGTVVKARQYALSRYVAVKLVRAGSSEDEALKRFMRETQILSGFSHMNVAKVYASGQLSKNDAYMVMEFIEGVSLDRVPPENITSSKFRRIFEQCAEALNALHQRDVVHRDIKPSNFILSTNSDNDHVVRLVDFGLSKKLLPENMPDQQLTKPGHSIGTPTYMSPEQCLGRELDGRSDIYSLGCCMYQLLTGNPPFVAETPHEVMAMHLKENMAPLATLRPEVSRWKELAAIENALQKCLAKEPANRYQTPRELIADLQSMTRQVKSLQRAPKAMDKRAVYACIGVISLAAAFFAVRCWTENRSVEREVEHKSSREIFRDFGFYNHIDRSFRSDETPEQRETLLHLTRQALEADDQDHLLTPRQRYSLLGTKESIYNRIVSDPSSSEEQRKQAAAQLKEAALASMTLNDRQHLFDSARSANSYVDLVRACEVAPPRLEIAQRLRELLKTDRMYRSKVEFRDACMRLARLYIYMNNPQEALACMKELNGTFDSDSHRFITAVREGMILLYNDHYAEAVERLEHCRNNEQCWQKNDEYVQGLLFRAYLFSGHLRKAQEVLAIIRSEPKPTNEAPQIEMLWAAKTGDWEQARENFEKVKDADIGDEKYFASMQDWDLRKVAQFASKAKQIQLAAAVQSFADKRTELSERLEGESPKLKSTLPPN